MQLRAMIVDDMPLARDDLRRLLAAHRDHIDVVCEAQSIPEAKGLLSQTELDVVFLDIELRQGSGFDLIEHIHPRMAIVFVTAYDTYAVRAFEVNALDYLTKPVAGDRLQFAIDRLLHRAGLDETSQPPVLLTASDVMFNSEQRRHLVRVDEIVGVTSIGGNYTSVLLSDASDPTVRRTLKRWMSVLPELQFLRAHRTNIVNIAYIDGVVRRPNGSYLLRIRDREMQLPLSRTMVAEARALI